MLLVIYDIQEQVYQCHRHGDDTGFAATIGGRLALAFVAAQAATFGAVMVGVNIVIHSRPS